MYVNHQLSCTGYPDKSLHRFQTQNLFLPAGRLMRNGAVRVFITFARLISVICDLYNAFYIAS